MSLVNQAKIDASQIGFSTAFNSAFDDFVDPIREIAMEVPSTTAVENQDWLGAIPGLTEWLDERRLDNLRAENIVVINKDWSSGIRIDRNDIADDRLGIVTPRLQALAQKAGRHYGTLIADFLLNGFATTKFGASYDGQAFFSASHKSGDEPTQSNTNAAALDPTAYDAARAGMQKLEDEFNEELGIMPTHILVGPDLERTALEVVKATAIANPAGTAGIQNVFAGTAEVIVSPKIKGAFANHWFLLDLSMGVKPIGLQIREAITSSFVTDANGAFVFMKKKFLFGAEGRHNCFYGLWQKAFGSSN